LLEKRGGRRKRDHVVAQKNSFAEQIAALRAAIFESERRPAGISLDMAATIQDFESLSPGSSRLMRLELSGPGDQMRI
jgi:hypothetical protein